MDAALEIIREKGEASLSLREISKILGVSAAAPYKHFGSKEDLLADIIQEGFLKFREYLLRRKEHSFSAPVESCKFMGESYLEFVLDHPDYYFLMFGHTRLGMGKYKSLNEAANRAFSELIGIVKEMQEAGVFRKEDPRKTSLYIWSTLHGFCSLIQNDRLKILRIDKKTAKEAFDEIFANIVISLDPSMRKG